MADALRTATALISSMGLEEVGSVSEVTPFTFYLGIRNLDTINVPANLFSYIPLMFMFEPVDNKRNFLGIDLDFLGKNNARKLYDCLVPYANVKKMDRREFETMRNDIIEKMGMDVRKQVLKKYRVDTFSHLYIVPDTKMDKVLSVHDALLMDRGFPVSQSKPKY